MIGDTKMKKILSFITVLLITACGMCFTAFADDADTADVFITIADENGKLVLTQEKITVTDRDNDGKITVDEALYAAHEAEFTGGAAAGYASSATSYGLSLDMLWGVANGGSYGYYVNNVSSSSLADEVKAGDYVNAFIYSDLTAWSDTYCYFDKHNVSFEQGGEISLTLTACGYDSSYNPITFPVEGAKITLNGTLTEYTTDAEGKVTFALADAGEYVISAVSDSVILVPPVLKASVFAKPEVVTEQTADEEVKTSPKTADNAYMLAALMLVSISGVAVGCKKLYEK